MKTAVPVLTDSERRQISEILKRRANDIASFKSDIQRKAANPNASLDEFPGSVEMALTREIERLRKLSDKINPPEPEGEDEP